MHQRLPQFIQRIVGAQLQPLRKVRKAAKDLSGHGFSRAETLAKHHGFSR
jgi:hypothetical protein